ncbi:hypothetical protein BGW36DRAFT_390267 [Talaromyces proteolyticus]|uniref:Uncharacterized protein n=1 Tax=Talaromyces proteolyticus TaxID=1131652 RepID=A0AAD4KEN3_9EURO|nr:uncharacterized protein BGW36DRAFT_390267 [Talaromyces proteolyticus]KAH8690135.1 hypothetical protein BGW36DRAFT_390267 [Talaromyces proteolyticus]
MDMPDNHPVESQSQLQAASKPDTTTCPPNPLAPASTISSSNTSSTASSTHRQHKRFLSFGSLETSSAKFINTIRSHSPLPRPSTPAGAKERRRQSPPAPPRRSPTPMSSSTSTSPVQTSSPSELSPTSSVFPTRPALSHHSRVPSDGSVGSSARTRSDGYKRYSGTLNHYGRHSNDWLFGGFSVRDTVRDGIEKLKGSLDRD